MNSTTAVPPEFARSQPSIVSHPWFPKVIALWFAALFGLSSLAVAPQMLESVVTTLGIDRVLPAAAPPLGQTARLLLALGMAGVGEIFGLLIGARLSAGRRPQPRSQRGAEPAGRDDTMPHVRGRDRHADAPLRKPLSAIDELSGIDHALRRRALASEKDHEPRPFFDVAPLPGADMPALAHAAVEAVAAVPAQTQQAAEPEVCDALDLANYDAPLEPAPFDAPPALTSSDAVAPPFAAPPAMAAEVAGPAAAPRTAPAVEIASASLDALGVVQLSERLAMALQARRARRTQHLASAVMAAPGEIVGKAIAPFEEAPVPAPAPAAPLPRLPGLYAPIAEASDDDEPHDIPALARSLTMPARPADLPEATTETPEPISPELQRGLDILVRRAPKADLEASSVAPIGLEVAPVAATEDAEGSQDDDLTDVADETAEGAYSSLLALGSSFARPEPVRIEEPQSEGIEPVVIFPGQGARTAGPFSGPGIASFGAPSGTTFGQPAPAAVANPVDTSVPPPAAAGTPPAADAEETDRALRAALDSLQRISGAR